MNTPYTFDHNAFALAAHIEPDILIVEGLNVLQTGETRPGRQPLIFVSDFFDFSIPRKGLSLKGVNAPSRT